MSRRPKEADLAHGSSDRRLGDAVLKCEGYTPDCLYFGRCSRGGECFASPAHLAAARKIESLLPKGQEAQHIVGRHWALLRKVAEMLRRDEICL